MSIKNRLLYNLMYLLPGRPPWDTGITPPEVVDFVNRHSPGKALDLGCGTGTNAVFLAKAGWQVTGIDFAPGAIMAARRKARQKRLKIDFRVGNAANPEVAGPFDLVLDIGCFHSISKKEREDYVQNLATLLTDSATYLLYIFFRNPEENGPGLVEEELKILTDRLTLVNRTDGTERGTRPSAWLIFRKEPFRNS